MDLTPEQIQLIADWNATKKVLTPVLETERKLRNQIVEQFYPIEEGTNRTELPEGWTLKISRSMEYKLENKNGETKDIVSDFPPEIAAMLVRWKPELIVKNYKALNPEYKDKLGCVLTIKPASPQVELIAPEIKV